MLAGIPGSSPGHKSGGDKWRSTELSVGIGMSVVGLIGMLVAVLVEGKAGEARSTAFDLYHDALLKRLDLSRDSDIKAR